MNRILKISKLLVPLFLLSLTSCTSNSGNSGDEQKQLFSLLPNTMDFISLTKSCLMLPIKSVSGIIGVGKEVRKTGYSCDICSNKACIYRKIRMNV